MGAGSARPARLYCFCLSEPPPVVFIEETVQSRASAIMFITSLMLNRKRASQGKKKDYWELNACEFHDLRQGLVQTNDPHTQEVLESEHAHA